MKKILVTGAGGLVGYEIAKLLNESPNYQVFPTVRHREIDELDHIIAIDLQKRDIETLKMDFDCVIHCAARIPSAFCNDEKAAVINRCIDDNIIQYCVKHSCRLIYISSMSVYGYDSAKILREDAEICLDKLSSKYTYEKRNSEIRIEDQCPNYCILRIPSPYGFRQKSANVFQKFMLAAYDGGKICYFGTGERTQNFIDARDIAQAVLKCIDHPTGIFNIAASYSVSMKQLAYLIQKIAERELNVSVEVCNGNTVDSQENVRINIDISLAEEMMGWQPQIELEDGIRYWMQTMKKGKTMEKIYEVGEIPFYYTILPTPYNPEGLPDKLQFLLTQDQNGIIRQYPCDKECEYLDLAYQKGSQISGSMDDNGIGKGYADDFMKFICESEKNIAGKKILEIGCGTGYLLYQLKQLGAEVLGIEPGMQGLEGKKKYDIPIMIDFFEAAKIREKYDIVIFYAVLEHMQDAEKFLLDVQTVLKADGKIFLSVPDCEPYIEAGDISLLFHEHWNYFTQNTLSNLLTKCGLQGSIVRSEFAGALYASLTTGKIRKLPQQINENLLSDYFKKAEIQKGKLISYIDSVISSQSLGIYVPGRVINLLSLCYKKVPDKIRFFDDNENLHGRFFPSIDIKIENFIDLINNPVDVMIIASFTFGTKIKEKLLNYGVGCKVVLIEELFM